MNILIIDDEPNIRKMLALSMESDGHAVVSVGNARDAASEAEHRAFDLAFVDLRLGTSDGLDLIPALLARTPWLKIIVVTAYASIESAVEAMRRGATDYLPKPFTPAQVKLAVLKASEMRDLERKIASLQDALGRSNPEIDFSTSNPGMRRVLNLARQIAPTETTVLLRGESGTGKTVLAKAIHGWSRRADKPFYTISCPSFSPELLESELFGHVKGAFTGADRENPGKLSACEGGTLLLDEIGDLPLTVQPKLLRFLQDKEFERLGHPKTLRADVRIIAATNRDLETAVAEKRFRDDLFYRLNVFPITVLPLRERPEDIVPIAERMLAFFGRTGHRSFQGFSPDAIEILRRSAWPGNIRELRNAVERASILSRAAVIGAELLAECAAKPADPGARLGDPIPLGRIEEEHIRRVLAKAKSLQEAADALGIDAATLWRRRKKYGI